jgi:sulfotransferase 6B1
LTSITRSLGTNEVTRRLAIAGYRALTRTVIFLPPPRTIANGIPKAGIHLLSSLLRKLPRMMFSGVHHALNDFSVSPGIGPEQIPDVDLERLERALSAVNLGQFMTAHFPAQPKVQQLLKDLGYKTVLMVRDPRDIVVSHTFYVTRLPRHFLFERYNTVYSTDEERLLVSITGFGKDEYGPAQESIGARIAKYMGWLDDPDACLCRFESLVGASGGGTAAVQRREIAAIAAHVGRPLTDRQLQRIASKVWSTRAATFRKGKIGDWQDHFNDEHKAAFKEVAGQVLIDLGYERDLDW